LGHRFGSQELLSTAVTHRSYANEKGIADYERLEFLGDAVLQLAVTRHLFREYGNLTEGQMTRVRAAVVRKETLAKVAKVLGVGEVLLLGKGEEQSGGRNRESILADAMEAVIGAVYEDGGWKSAERLVMKHWRDMIAEQAAVPDARDPKTHLQETLALDGQTPEYRRSEDGPGHAKEFRVEVWIGGERLGEGEGPSRRVAEQRAAAHALEKLIPGGVVNRPRPAPSIPPTAPGPEPSIVRRLREWGNRRSGPQS
jgi:ribonuclease-3